MTRSIKALSGAAMLAALVLPAVASAQDTSSTGGRVTRDSASGRTMGSMNGVRFDTTQAIALTGVTIVRIDSLGGGNGAWNSGARRSMDSAATTGTGSATVRATGTSTAGTSGTAGTAASGASMHAGMHHGGASTGQPLSVIIRSGTDSMQVVLGPSEYLASMRVTLSAGDVIDIKGVRLAAGAAGMGAGAAGALRGSATGSSMSAGSVTSTSSTGSTGATTDGTGASAVITTILATEITKGGTSVQLRDKTTGEPSWETMGSDAGKNRGMMTKPMTKDTSRTTSPVRKP